MEKTGEQKISKVLAVILVCIVLGLTFTSAVQAESVCEKALSRCMVDDVISLILSGPQTGAAYGLGCLNGYVWCLNYYL